MGFDDTTIQWLYILVGICVSGVVCNLCVIWIILRNPRSGSYFLINLSCSDLLFCLSLCTTSLINIHTGEWTDMACNLSGVMSGLCGCQNLLSLALISLDRYLCIVKTYRASKSQILILIGLSWIYSIIIAVCPLLGWSQYAIQPSNVYCIGDWALSGYIDVMYTIWGALTLWGSVTAVFIFYALITRHTLRVSRGVARYTDTSLAFIREQRASRRMFTIVAVAIAVWVLYGINFVYQLVSRSSVPYYMDMMSLVMIAMGGNINPFVYIIINKMYRDTCCHPLRSPVTIILIRSPGSIL